MSIMEFTLVEDAACVLRLPRGVYKQVKVYTRKGFIYAGFGSGFVRLYKNMNGANGTSNPNVVYDDLYLPFKSEHDNVGRLLAPKKEQ